MSYVVVSKVKGLAKEHGRRVGRDFLEALDQHVEKLLLQACRTHNGRKMTLDASVAVWVGMGNGGTHA